MGLASDTPFQIYPVTLDETLNIYDLELWISCIQGLLTENVSVFNFDITNHTKWAMAEPLGREQSYGYAASY